MAQAEAYLADLAKCADRTNLEAADDVSRTIELLKHLNNRREGLLFGARPIFVSILDYSHDSHSRRGENLLLWRLCTLAMEHLSVYPNSILEYTGLRGSKEPGQIHTIVSNPSPYTTAFGDGSDPPVKRQSWLEETTMQFFRGVSGPGEWDYESEAESAAMDTDDRASLDSLLNCAAERFTFHRLAKPEYNCHAIVYGLHPNEEDVPKTDKSLVGLWEQGVQVHWITGSGGKRGWCKGINPIVNIRGVGNVIYRLEEQTRARIAARAGGQRLRVDELRWRGQSLGSEILAVLSPDNWTALLRRFECASSTGYATTEAIVPIKKEVKTSDEVESQAKSKARLVMAKQSATAIGTEDNTERTMGTFNPALKTRYNLRPRPLKTLSYGN